MEKLYCVYEHVFPNGKKYIGISSDVEKRWRNGKGYETQGKIANAISHYGWENVKHNVIVGGVTKEQAEALERYLIAELDTIKNGYNTAIGGENINSTYLNEHVLQMIRESKRLDEKYSESQKQDDIVSIAEKGKHNKRLAELLNEIDEYVVANYPEIQRFKTNCVYDGSLLRCDSYWWYVREVYLVSVGEKHSVSDYWKTLQSVIWGGE
jgi:hypothetical protein